MSAEKNTKPDQVVDIAAVHRHVLELARLLLPTGMLLAGTRERAASLPGGKNREKYLRQVRALERAAARKGIEPTPCPFKHRNVVLG